MRLVGPTHPWMSRLQWQCQLPRAGGRASKCDTVRSAHLKLAPNDDDAVPVGPTCMPLAMHIITCGPGRPGNSANVRQCRPAADRLCTTTVRAVYGYYYELRAELTAMGHLNRYRGAGRTHGGSRTPAERSGGAYGFNSEPAGCKAGL